MAIIREFNLHTNAGPSIPPVIHVNQYDRGETWKFKLYQPNGQQLTPTDAAIVGIKSDGHIIANAGTVSGGVISITETEQMTAAPGKAVFEILFDNDTHGTANFIVLVEPSPTEGGIASDSDLSLFQEAIDSISPATINAAVSAWMSVQLTPSEWVIDNSLTVANAAADAKKAGDLIRQNTSDIGDLTELVTEDQSSLVGAINETRTDLYNWFTDDIEKVKYIYDGSAQDADIYEVKRLEWAAADDADITGMKVITRKEGTSTDTSKFFVDGNELMEYVIGDMQGLTGTVTEELTDLKREITNTEDYIGIPSVFTFGQTFTATSGADIQSAQTNVDVDIPANTPFTISFVSDSVVIDGSNINYYIRSESAEIGNSYSHEQSETVTLTFSENVKKIRAYVPGTKVTSSGTFEIVVKYETEIAETSLTNRVSETEKNVEYLLGENTPKYLYEGEYVQGGFSATAETESTARIHMADCVALPYGDKTEIHVEFTPGYLFAVRAGRTPQNLSSNKYWYNSGDTVEFTDHEQYYRIIWAKGTSGNYQPITPSDIDTISPVITYTSKLENGDSIDVNADNLERLTNAQNMLSESSHGGIGSMPMILHISDVHGDLERVKNALSFSEYCGADAVVVSGDIVANKPSDGVGWMHSLFDNFNGKPVICTGNHEVNQDGITDQQVYEYFMEPSAEKLGSTTGKTYYYTDIPSKMIRIISIDLYQYGATTRSSAHMSDEQLSFICSALKTTPSGYGILMVEHSPCVDVANLKDSNYPTFFQSLRKYGFTHYGIVGTPIYDIVDAFISRGSITKGYAQSGTPSAISVSDDFTNVDPSIEFIAHLTGHIHEDSVCYLPTVNKQLMLNICCGVAMTGGASYPYLADDCDITKLPYGKTQDTLNAYVIDRGNKAVKIVRLGGTLTYDMKDRKYMAIPYAD